MVLIRSHDALFRYVFGEPEQMAELVRALLPPAAAADVDWSTLTRIDGTFVDPARSCARNATSCPMGFIRAAARISSAVDSEAKATAEKNSHAARNLQFIDRTMTSMPPPCRFF